MLNTAKNWINKIKSFVLAEYPAFMLFLLVAAMFVTNYKSGTFLTGWDNIHSEYDSFGNFFTKSLFGVWQEGYGLGLTSGNAVVTEIFRQPFVWLLDVVLPKNLVRYVWHFSTLYVGALGLYFLLRRVLAKDSPSVSKLSSLAASVFYLFNLGTVQNFYVPVESFSHFFAFLPWLLLLLIKVLSAPSKRNIALFFVVNLLATPMFYFPTVFIIYFLFFLVFVGIHVVATRKIRLVFGLSALVLLANSYWIMPFAYFFTTGGPDIVEEARINKFFTEDAYLRNNEFGKYQDVSLLRGVWFGTTDLAGERYGYMMQPWITHFENHLFLFFAYFLVFVAIVGLISTVITRTPYRVGFATVLVISLIALISSNPPTGFLFDFLRNYVPLFKQVFRLPFTKFIVPASFVFSLYLGLGSAMVLRYIPTSRNKISFVFPVALIVLTLVTYSPVFQGNFIYQRMKVTVPGEYFKLFDYFASKDVTSRIANLPQPRFFGWVTYNWGYRGSGFPWYAIKQPILDRAFDVWSPYNEQYYRELSHAIYSKDAQLLEKVLEKFDVKYVWVDESEVYIENSALLFTKDIKELLDSSSKLKLDFSEGSQKVYAYVGKERSKSYISQVESAPVLNSQKLGFSYDTQFDQNGDYLVQSGQSALDSGSAVQVFDGLDKGLGITADKENITVLSKLSSGMLMIPNPLNSENFVLSDLSLSNTKDGFLIDLTPKTPDITINNSLIKLITPPVSKLMLNKPLAQGKYIVRVNDSIKRISVPLKEATPGFAVLRTQEENVISVFSDNLQYNNISESIFAKPLDNCKGFGLSSLTTYSKTYLGGPQASIEGRNSRPCFYVALSDLLGSSQKEVQEDALLSLQFEYKHTSKDGFDVCFFKIDENECVRGQNFRFSDNGDFALGVVTVPLAQKDLEKGAVKFQLNADNAISVSNLWLRNLKVAYLSKPLATKSFFVQGSKDSKYAWSGDVKNGDELKISHFYPVNNGFFNNQMYLPSIVKDKAAQNCDPVNSVVYKRVYVDDKEKGYIEFYSERASSCDNDTLSDIVYNPGYIASITTKNILGRPLVLCIKEDPPGFCSVFTFVSSSDEGWASDLFVLPPSERSRSSVYSMVLDNYSVGDQVKINRISDSYFIPVPYKWLMGIKLTGNEGAVVEVGSGSKATQNAQRLAPFLYTVQVDDSLKGGTLALSQGFDRGWLALGNSLGKHLLVNGWANGWRVTSSGVVYLLFWPQLLVFLGLLIACVPVIYFFLLYLRSKRNR